MALEDLWVLESLVLLGYLLVHLVQMGQFDLLCLEIQAHLEILEVHLDPVPLLVPAPHVFQAHHEFQVNHQDQMDQLVQ